jgi:single-strand DNA-binding protein
MANNITVSGRISSDPELRYTVEGKALCRFKIPVYAGKNKDGGYNPSLWVKIVLWESDAEFVAEHYKKGDDVQVTGYLGYEEWMAKDGSTKGDYTINKPEVTRVTK